VIATSLVGREQAIDDVAGLFWREAARLVTLTGPGGIGKTRLALAVGERLSDRFESGTAFVSLAGVTEAEQVLAAIARSVGAEPGGPDASLSALVERFGDGRWPLILDNLEHLVDAARDLGELLTRCPWVAVLATSLAVLRLRAEREYPVPPLALPPDPRHCGARRAPVVAGRSALRRARRRGAPRLRSHPGHRPGGCRDLPAPRGRAGWP
jgi:predicted ATPase